jgi:hypothetical protein
VLRLNHRLAFALSLATASTLGPLPAHADVCGDLRAKYNSIRPSHVASDSDSDPCRLAVLDASYIAAIREKKSLGQALSTCHGKYIEDGNDVSEGDMSDLFDHVLRASQNDYDRHIAACRSTNSQANAEICGVGVGAFHRTMCVGPGNDCECIGIGNTCPYPITVFYTAGGRRLSFSLEAGKVSEHDACTTKEGEQVGYSTFKPWAGYPKPGQPAPSP